MRLLLIFCAVLLLAGAAAHYVSPTVVPVYYAGITMPVVLILTFGLCVWAFYRGKYREAGGAVVLLLVFHQHAQHVVNYKNPLPDVQPQLRVLSLNTHLLAYPGGHLTEEVAADFKRFVIDADAHVLCFQELNNRTHHFENFLAKTGLKESYPYVFKPAGVGVGVLSKYPILKSADTKIWQGGNGAVWADIQSPVGTHRIFSVHLLSNRITSQSEAMLKGQSDQDFQDELQGLMKRVSSNTDTRLQQALAIRKLADASPHPVIICGDLNEVPQSRVYRVLSYRRLDAFVERGFGWGKTYRGMIPLLRLDVQLCHPSLMPIRYKKLSAPHTDHFGLLVTYVAKPVE